MSLDANQVVAPIKNAEETSASLLAALDPLQAVNQLAGKIPFYTTGASALIKLGGKQLGVCTEAKYSLSYQGVAINTIDTPHAFDIDVGSCTIQMSLSNIVSPTASAESQSMFHTMASGPHAPMVEVQILSPLGTSLFFARGLFLRIDSGISLGQVSTFNAQFMGVAYQNWVSQSFKPYNSFSSKLFGFVNGLSNLTSSVI